MNFSSRPYLVQLAAYTALFAATMYAGLMFSYVQQDFIQLWSPAGVSMALLYFAGVRFLPVIFIGTALNYFFLLSSPFLAVMLAIGSTAEGYVGYLLLRNSTFDPRMRRIRDIGIAVLYAGGIATAVNALFSVTAAGMIQPSYGGSYPLLMLVWWLGNIAGVIVTAPTLFAMFSRRFEHLALQKVVELLVGLAMVSVVSHGVFHGKFFTGQLNYSFAFLLFPFAIGATIRFGLIGSVLTTYIISLSAILSTQTGLGLFAAENYVTSIILVDIFLIVLGSTSLALAALIEERNSAESEIRKSEESYRIITERTGQLIYDYSVESGSIMWSGAVEAVTGYSPEEFARIGIAEWAEHIHPGDRDRAESRLTEAMRNHEEYNIEYRFRKKDGHYLSVLDRGAFLYRRPSDETAYRMLGTMADVTNIKASEAKLRESEIRYRLFSLLATDYVYSSVLTDEGFRTEWASPTFERLLGYTLDEVNAGGWNDIIHPDDLQRTINETATLSVDNPLIMEYRIFTRKGELRWIRDFMQPIPELSNESTLRIIGGVQDITAQKNAQLELSAKEERFRMLIEKSADGIILMNKRGVIEYASPAATTIIGFTPEELVGTSVFAMLHPAEAKRNAFKFGRLALEFERSDYLLGRFKRKNGDWVHIEGMVTNLLQNPNVNAFVANFRNVTERIIGEERLRRSLQEKEILLKEVHHRVKNNMQVISSLLNLQANAVKDRSSAAMLRESQHRVKSMALVHEILYQSRDIASVNFSKYVKQLVASLQQSYGARGADVTIVVQVAAVSFDIDKAIPCGLIINELVSNAVKYAFPKRKGTITVSLTKNRRRAFVLTVKDDGIGFARTGVPRSAASLGLNLVQALTDQLKGTLEITNKRGSTIVITFPEQNPAVA